MKSSTFSFGSLPLLFLAIIPLLAFYPVFLHPLKYDLITTAYPWRYFIGECLQHHILPLWNPYQHLGYPIHADPQSGAWYLPAWIIGYFSGYSLFSVAVEFLAHIILAGYGMRWLAVRLQFNGTVAATLGLAYGCSGFFAGHAQHLPFLISATWIPFILASLLQLAGRPTLANAGLTALFSWLLLTGGYPGFTVILLYFLACLLCWMVYVKYKREGKKQTVVFLMRIAAAALLALVLSSPLLVSFYQALPLITREGGVNLGQALVCPFSPQSGISLLAPLAAVADPAWFGTDLSMTNAYFGMLPFLAFILSFGYRDRAVKWIFLAFSVFALLAAMGDYLPLRRFLWQYAPLMDQFRMPGIFRLFFILGALVFSGYFLDRLANENLRTARQFTAGYLVLLAAGLGGLITGMAAFSSDPAAVFRLHFLTTANQPGIGANLLINNLVLLALLTLFGAVRLLFRNRINLLTLVFFFTATDLVLAVRMVSPYTVYNEEYLVADIDRYAEGFPAAFPLPVMEPVGNNTDRGLGFQSLWLNLHCFFKQPGIDGYNPFALKAYEDLQFRDTAGFAGIIRRPPAFLTGDTNRLPSFLVFEPNSIILLTNTVAPDTLCILQNHYPGWKTYLNGKRVVPGLAAGCFPAVAVEKGVSKIAMIYRPVAVIAAWWVSLAALPALLLFMLNPAVRWRSRRQESPSG